MLWPFAGRACDDVRDSLALAGGRARPARSGGVGQSRGSGLDSWPGRPRVPALETQRVIPPASRRRLLRLTGTDGSHAVLDAGPHGYQNGGHAHADALSLTLSIDGHPLLIDPGTSTYTMDSPLRDDMRSTASHNTVTLDGRSQSVPDGPFHWQSTVDARVAACRRNRCVRLDRCDTRRLCPGASSANRRAHRGFGMAHCRCHRR